MRDDLVPRPVLARIKQATRLLIAELGGNKDAAALCGVREGTMTRWGSLDYPDVMPLHVVAALELRTGSPTVTRVMADLTGYSLSLAGAPDAAEDVTRSLLDVVGSGADAALVMARVIDDGRITPGEVNEALTALGRATEANTRAGKAMAARVKGRR